MLGLGRSDNNRTFGVMAEEEMAGPTGKVRVVCGTTMRLKLHHAIKAKYSVLIPF